MCSSDLSGAANAALRGDSESSSHASRQSVSGATAARTVVPALIAVQRRWRIRRAPEEFLKQWLSPIRAPSVLPNPSLHPTCYGWLRQPPPAGELQCYMRAENSTLYCYGPYGEHCNCAQIVLNSTSLQLIPAYSSQGLRKWSSPDFVDTFQA